MPTLNRDVAMWLIEKYPGTRRVGLDSMWVSAWAWIEQQVSAEYLIPGCVPTAFESAAILRVQAICAGNNPAVKQALIFAAIELLAPYAR